MRLLILFPLSFLIACQSNNHRQASESQTKNSSPKVDTTESSNRNRFEKFNLANYRIHTQKIIGNYSISLWQDLSNNGDSPFLLINDTLTHKKDTLELSDISDLQERKVDIEDITKSVGFRQLTLSLTWQGESDGFYSEVIGYQSDTLKELFDIPAGALVDIKRKDQWTLQGHVLDRDDIVYMAHDNYIIIVSLKDYAVNIYSPDTLAIDYYTTATDTIHTYRILPSGKQVPYTVLPDIHFHIDTFYSRQQVVSLHLDDSMRLRVHHDSITLKVKGNIAG